MVLSVTLSIIFMLAIFTFVVVFVVMVLLLINISIFAQCHLALAHLDPTVSCNILYSQWIKSLWTLLSHVSCFEYRGSRHCQGISLIMNALNGFIFSICVKCHTSTGIKLKTDYLPYMTHNYKCEY